MSLRSIFGSALVLAIGACTVDVDGGSGLGGAGSLGTSGDSPGGTQVDEGTDEGLETSDDASGLPAFDVGSPDGNGWMPPMGCTKVDFLFVIDNSRSMQGKQAALAATFEPFMLAIQQSLSTDDVHVMVVDTDAETLCTPERCANPNNATLKHCIDGVASNDGYACKAQFEACDSQMGGGVVHPAGNHASNQKCAVTGNKRYLDDSDDLVSSFACTAKVGTAGDRRERPMDAMVAALAPSNGCNAGFLRDDAILVVTFISDDQCYEDSGTPNDWKHAVVQAKNGDESAVVVLGLLPNTDTCKHHNEACDSPDHVIDGQHWLEFVGLWENGLAGSVCATEQFADLFTAAIGLIAHTCEGFEPPG